jgi:hypothetical protein
MTGEVQPLLIGTGTQKGSGNKPNARLPKRPIVARELLTE